MRCPNCGKENGEDRIICFECLKPLKKENDRSKKKRFLIIAALAVAVAAAVLAILLNRPKQVTIPEEKPGTAVSDPAEDTATRPETTAATATAPPRAEPLAEDAEAYFSERGNVIGKTDAASSQDVHSEAETVSELKGRGLTQYSVTAEYSADGHYSGASDASADSQERHPMYTTYYVASNGDIWTITEINGRITAYPVTWNMNAETGTETILSETETIISYDSVKNCFYETIPDPSVLIVKKVERIDAETLEKLSTEGVDSL